jgi:hypothetical protein
VSALKCERCRTRRAIWACLDEPEEEGAYFGDEVDGLVLCTPCLDLAEVDGPWSLVTRLDGPRQAAA